MHDNLGGADTRYTFVNGTDYRKDNISVKYQLQAIHSTMVHHYNDTIDMLVYYKDTTHSLVKVQYMLILHVEDFLVMANFC